MKKNIPTICVLTAVTLFIINVPVTGLPIQVQPVLESAKINHCLISGQPIQFRDPFDYSLHTHIKFVLMSWLRQKSELADENIMLNFVKGTKEPEASDKYGVYENWGLQINDARMEDAGNYTAVMIMTSGREYKAINVTFIEPPKLFSDSLSVKVVFDEPNQMVTLTCGQVSYFGNPPVSIYWKFKNGDVLPAAFENGYAVLKLPLIKGNENTTCELNFTNPAAQCIPKEELLKWNGFVPPNYEPKSSVSTGTIAGIAAAAGVAVIIIIIVIIIVIKKCNKGKTYNAQKHEEKRSAELGQLATESPLLDRGRTNFSEDTYDSPRIESKQSINKKPIYTGPKETGPYMVSNISKENMLPKASTGNGKAPPVKSGMFLKKGESKDGEKGQADDEPPRTKPRSIFLSPSMEELDRIAKAGTGRQGIHGSENKAGTLV